MKQKVYLLAASAVLVALVAFLTIQGRSVSQSKAAEPANALPAKAEAEADVKDPKRADDDAAIRKASTDFIKLVESGDAKGVAASWTEDGEYIGDDGTSLRGRAAIEVAYTKAFAKKKRTKVEIH